MTPRARAIRIAHRIVAPTYTAAAFEVMLADKSEGGELARKVTDAIEAGIVEDRRALASLTSPS